MDTANKRQTVLITGGRTLIGRRLTEYLRGRGYRVLWLTRDVSGSMDMCDETFYWDIEQNVVADHALREADIVIHLAGASLHSERWTPKRKREILRSRVRSARILTNALSKVEHHVHTIIYGSSLNIYRTTPQGEPLHESEAPADTFIGQTFAMLEHEAEIAEERLGVRTLILRNGIALDPYAGILPYLVAPVRFGLNTPIGKGEQYINWIHQQDLCRIYEYAITQTDMRGVYNAAAPGAMTNSQFMYALSTVYGRDHIRIPVSSFIIRTVLGEMGDRILGGRPASVDKLLSTGFAFNYQTLSHALRDLVIK